MNLPKSNDINTQAKNHLLTIITVVLLLGLFKLAANILWPLAFAIFLIAIFWPLQWRLQERMRLGLATFLTVLAFFVTIVLFGAALWYSASLVAEGSSRYADQIERFLSQAEAYGIPIPNHDSVPTLPSASYWSRLIDRVVGGTSLLADWS